MNAATISWSNPSDGPAPEGVYIEVTGPEGFAKVVPLPGPVTQGTVSGLRNGVTYSFRVITATRDGSGEPTDWVSATPSTGMEGVVAGLIVEFEPGSEKSKGEQDVPGEDRVGDVDLAVAEKVNDDAVLVELSEPVDVDTATRIAEDLAADEEVAWAEPDQFFFTSNQRAGDDLAQVVTVPSDSQYASSQWNLWDSFGITIGDGNDAMTDAWDGPRGDGVTVAVIDTGITDHPDLANQLVPGYDFVSNPDKLAAVRQANAPPVAFDGDYVDEVAYGALGRDSNPSDPGDWREVTPVRDSSWHGTKVAGVIAAEANNNGITGIAPGAKIQPIRALSWRGGLLSDIAASITWASGGTIDDVPANSNPSKVINLSFAVETTCPVALQDAIDGAIERGSILVAAAGNASDDASKFAPGNCNGVITVAATNRDGQRADYSNYGQTVDIAAPGGDGANPITVTTNAGTRTPDLTNPSTTGTDSGTSIAAAHVSAAAAILASRTANLSPEQAYRTLTGTDYTKAFGNDVCDSGNPDYACGTGILTLAQIAATVGTAPCVATVSSTSGVTASQDDGDCVLRFTSNNSFTTPAGVDSVHYLIVGGGGGGGTGDNGTSADDSTGGGGGGAGGLVTSYPSGTPLDVTGVSTLTVEVGAGGSGGGSGAGGSNGIASSLKNGATTLQAASGGGGGAAKNAAAGSGGSGGGGARSDVSSSAGTGTGTEGNNGGVGVNTNGYGGAGGGGYGSVGGSTVSSGVSAGEAGDGGSGFDSDITGSSVGYAGGGGGGRSSVRNSSGGEATDGGGRGSNQNGVFGTNISGENGTANTGGGGGGGGGTAATTGGNGGSGVVILRYTPWTPTAVSGEESATVSWSAVTPPPGHSVFYEVTSSPGSLPCQAGQVVTTSCVVTGLTAGTSYTFTVTVITSETPPTSATSGASNAVTPYGPLTEFTVEATGGGNIANQTAGTAFAIDVTAVDSGGRTVEDFTGTVDISSTSLFAAVGGGGGTTAAFTSGVLTAHSVTLVRAGTAQTLTATRTTGGSQSGTSNTFDVNVGTATQLQTLLPGETAAPGTTTGKTGSPTSVLVGSSVVATVNAVDAYWNLVTAQTPTVAITSSDAAAVLPANAALVAGTNDFTVTLNTVGNQTVTATAQAPSSLTASTSAALTVRALPIPAPPPWGGPSPSAPVQPPASMLDGDGNGIVLLDGQAEGGVTASPADNGSGWGITGPGFTMDVQTQNAEGSTRPLLPGGVLQVPQGGYVDAGVTGYQPGSTLAIFAIPKNPGTPGSAIWLGSAIVGPDGSVTMSLLVPLPTNVGDYVLQINGLSTAGQLRSANLQLVVTPAMQMRAGEITKAAFFQGRSDELTRGGQRKLREMVAAIPSGAQEVVVSVIGVSVSMDTPRENLRLARIRAQVISDFLEEQGVAGRYRVAVFTEFDVAPRTQAGALTPRALSLDEPVTSSKGKPLTTTSIAFEAPSSG